MDVDADPEEIQRDIYQFGTSLNQALALSSQRSTDRPNGDQFIAAIVLVKGVPFYGYHIGYQTYLKIHMLDPADKHRLVEILQSGVVQGTSFQPHESHIPFELQFMMDYNLFGMNWIHIHADTNQQSITKDDDDDDANIQLSLRFRQPLMSERKSLLLDRSQASSAGTNDSLQSSVERDVYYTSQTVPEYLQWSRIDRSSYCELEVDTTVMTIGNRQELEERSIHTDLQSEMIPPREKLVKSLQNIWADEANRRKTRGESMPSSSTLDSPSDQRVPQMEGWSTEQHWKDMIEQFLQAPDTHDRPNTVEGQDYPNIMTAFQSVEALYSQEYRQRRESRVTEGDVRRNSVSSPRLEPSTSPIFQTMQFNDVAEASAYNVSATPSRYRTMSQSSKADVDPDILRSLMESQSFHEADKEIAEEEIVEEEGAGDSQLFEEEQELPPPWFSRRNPYRSPPRRHMTLGYEHQEEQQDDSEEDDVQFRKVHGIVKFCCRLSYFNADQENWISRQN